MEEIKLYINNQLADLPADAARQIRVRKGAADVSELGSRTSDISYTMALPLTRGNERIFGNRSRLHRIDKFRSLSPYSAVLEVSGRTLLRGYFQLTSIKGAYVGRIVSEEVDVFALLEDKSLRDIASFAPFAFEGQHGFEERLALGIDETDAQFPLVAYGNFFREPVVEGQDVPASNEYTGAVHPEDYPPAVYLLAVIRKIFADVGWQVAGEPLRDELFQETVLPYVGDGFQWNWGTLLRYLGDDTGVSNPLTQRLYFTQLPDGWQPGQFVIIHNASYSTGELGDPGGHTLYWKLSPQEVLNPFRYFQVGDFRARKGAGYRVVVTTTLGEYAADYQPDSVLLSVIARKPGQGMEAGRVLAQADVLNSGPYPGSAVGTFTLDTGVPVYVDEEDLLSVCISVATSRNAYNWGDFQVTHTDTRIEILPEELVGPTHIDLAANLPDLGQLDMVRLFVTMGNLRFDTDAEKRTVTFYYHDRYELPADFAVELTGLANPEDAEYLPALPYRSIAFTYADDTADAVLQAVKGFADKLHDSRNLNLEGEKTMELPVAPVAMRRYAAAGGAEKVLPCMASQDQLATPLNQVQWAYGYLPRLLRYQGPSQAGDVISYGGVPMRYGLASFEGLDFEALYQRFYSNYITEVTRGHLVKLRFMLSPELYRRLSPARPVLFHGILYRFNKADGFQVSGESATELELLHIVREASGGGKPQNTEEAAGREFYGGEFSSAEWY
ncbi:hypothetical protein [Pontibacter mangrovi]|uniref:Uncharacterized protein n=1 Tax=Pontibacter mangrovi TaxID=2589816 RepID=A0A501W8T4_9BACT|nr:hypothetical protein [Pontibacter mangrovi]TPE44935.1 hypothetical protein FJM65_07935 [Pontibacter mangrovi]